MQTRNLSAKGTQGNSANGEEMTEARLLWEIGQHKNLEERTYSVLAFLAAVVGNIASCDDGITLNAEERTGMQYIIQDVQNRLSRACFTWMGPLSWRGEFLDDDFSVVEYEPDKNGAADEYKPMQGAGHE